MGFFRSYMRQFSPGYIADQRRREFQKKQWRKRVDARMRAARQPSVRNGTGLYDVLCPNCSAALQSPASENIKCPTCGFHMWVRTGVRSTTVRPAKATTTRRSSTASELERLARLHESGALTDDEFAAAKARALSGT
jgi:DNA-directed RNA polymerase subunit RPC12/RpoP